LSALLLLLLLLLVYHRSVCISDLICSSESDSSRICSCNCLNPGGRQFIGVDVKTARDGDVTSRDGDVTRLQYPSAQLAANSCLHVDYLLVGQVHLEVGYHVGGQSGAGHLLCTLVPNSTYIGWLSADILLPAGQYQLYFDAVILSLEERPVMALDSIKLLEENCSLVTFTG